MTINRKRRSEIWNYTLEYIEANERSPVNLSGIIDYVASKGVRRGSVYPYIGMFLKKEVLKIEDNKIVLTEEAIYNIDNGRVGFGSISSVRRKRSLGSL